MTTSDIELTDDDKVEIAERMADTKAGSSKTTTKIYVTPKREWDGADQGKVNQANREAFEGFLTQAGLRLVGKITGPKISDDPGDGGASVRLEYKAEVAPAGRIVEVDDLETVAPDDDDATTAASDETPA